jgi:hypothetical protein
MTAALARAVRFDRLWPRRALRGGRRYAGTLMQIFTAILTWPLRPARLGLWPAVLSGVKGTRTPDPPPPGGGRSGEEVTH